MNGNSKSLTLKQIFKRSFLTALIISLVLSAIAGIIIFLLGTFDEIEFKILFTTFVIGVFSLTGLINASLLDRESFKVYGFSALTISVLASLLLLLSIWFNFDHTQITTDLVIIALASTHISLLLVINTIKDIVRLVRVLTFSCIVILAGLLIYLFNNWSILDNSVYYRFIGIFAILDALGTITVPILNKLIKS
jgi:hypothetical protein